MLYVYIYIYIYVYLNIYICVENYSSIRPQIAKACKRFFSAAPCIGSNSNFYMQYSVACLHYAHSQRQHPAPAPNLHHAHNEHQQPGGTLCPPRAQPAPARQLTAPHAHSQHPAPCFHHARSQLTAPSTSTQHPRPVCTTGAASSQSTTHTQHSATAPSIGTLSPPCAQQGITTYDLARKSLCTQKYARKQQSP